MTQNELLLLIAFLTGVTAIIQCIEMYMLISSSRRTNELLEDPSPLIVSIVEKINKDPAFAKCLGSLLVFAGSCAMSEFRDIVAGKMPKVKPPKNLGEALAQGAQMLFSLPGIQQAAEEKAKKIVGGVAEETVAQTGWGL